MRNPEIRSLLNLTHAALSLLSSPSFCLPFLLSSSHLSIVIPCGHSFSSSLKVKVSPSSEVWWQQSLELHATEFWEICNFKELLIGLPLVLFGHKMSQSPLTGLQRPLPKGTGTGRLLSLPLQNYASFPDPAPPFALLDLLRLACMLESDPELELSLQKYVMESILKQVFAQFDLLAFIVKDLGHRERSRKPVASKMFHWTKKRWGWR